MSFKLLSILLIAILNPISSFSQWAPIGAFWHTGIIESYFSVNQGFKVTQSVSDTVLLGTNCKLLISETHHSFPSNVVLDTNYMYEDNGVVYDYFAGQFSILYNFNANSGDTWNIRVPFPSPFLSGNPPDTLVTIYVDSTSITTISGQSRKVLYVHSVDNDWYFWNPIIEGVGSSGGIYPFIYDWMDIDIPFLRCYTDSNLNYMAQQVPCDTIINKNEELSDTNKKIILYPNPASEQINILTSESVKDRLLVIYDVTGQVKRTTKILAGINEVNVDVSNLNPGSYFFELRTEEKLESGVLLKF